MRNFVKIGKLEECFSQPIPNEIDLLISVSASAPSIFQINDSDSAIIRSREWQTVSEDQQQILNVQFHYDGEFWMSFKVEWILFLLALLYSCAILL